MNVRVALAILACASGVFWSPILVAPAAHIAGGNGDPLLVAYIVTWVAEHLGSAGVWHPPFFHPTPNVLAWSEHLFGLAVLAWPAVAAGVSPVVLVNAIGLSAFLLTSIAIFFWLLDDRHAPGPALAATLIVTYGAWRVQQLSHPHLLFTPFLPVALVCYGRAITRGGPGWLLWSGAAALALQTLCTPSLSVFLVPSLTVWIVALGVVVRQRTVRLWAPLVASLAAAAAVNYPIAIRYWAEGATLDRNLAEIARFSVHWIDWISAPATHWLYGDLLNMTRGMERELFPGIGFLAVLGLGCAVAWSRLRGHHAFLWPGIAAGLFALWASAGPSGSEGIAIRHLPYDLVQAFVPGGQQVRVPARFVLVAGLFLAPALAAGWQEAFNWLRRRLPGPRTVSVAAVGLVLLVTLEALPGRAWYEPAIDFEPGAVPDHLISGGVVFVPISAGPRNQVRWMWTARGMGVPLVNGYSGHASPLFQALGHLERSQTDEVTRRAVYSRLLHAGVDTIVVEAPMPGLVDPDQLQQLDERTYRIPPALAVPFIHRASLGTGPGLLLASSGWSYPERAGDESWMWSQDSRATLLIPMDGTRRLRLALRARLVERRDDERLEIWWNGRSLGAQWVRSATGWLTFPLPEPATRAGWTRFELRGPAPVSVPQSADRRRLSVCVYEITWE